MKRITTLVFAAVFLAVSAFSAFAAEKLVVYTSMKESIIGSLKEAFVKKYPDIAMDYQSAGAGKLMAKIATERQSGKIMADIIWTSEVPERDGLAMPKAFLNSGFIMSLHCVGASFTWRLL